MLLVNDKLPNHKFSVGGKTIETDKDGVIEITEQRFIDSFLSSGFTKMEKKAEQKLKTQPARPVDSAKDEEVEKAFPKNDPVEAKPEVVAKKWTRSK